jgi:ATP-binding cassette, subfamily G (WHITE), eye pigment precursor transporter
VSGVCLCLPQGHSSWRNLMGMMFAMVVAVLILCSMNVALKFPVEWSIFMREYYTGANALGPYFIGRTIADIPFLALFLIMCIIPYWMAGLTATFSNFINFCVIFFLVINASASTGYMASSFSANPVLGLIITPIVDTPMILFSGMLYERSRVPLFLQWMQYVSVVNYGFAALIINEVRSFPSARGPCADR